MQSYIKNKHESQKLS